MRDWKDYLRTQEIKVVKIETIKPFENNPRLNKKAVPAVAASIKRFGFRNPILVDAEGVIIEGHTRRLAALELGMKQVPVVYVTDLTQDEVDALRVIDNKTAELADWDMDKLADEMMRLPDFNFGDFGFDLSTFTDSEEIKGKTDDDYVPEIEESQEPISKRGEVYLLGDHRLMCGDSTSADEVARLMNGEKADMVFTDMPYGMDLDTDYSSMKNNLDFAKKENLIGGKKYAQGKVDDFTPEMVSNIFACFNYVKEMFLFGADYFAELLPNKNDGSWIVWDKRANGNDDLEQDLSSDKMYGSCFELCWSKNKHKRDIARIKWAGLFGIEKEFDHKRHHPTQKPTALVQWFLDRYSKDEQSIVDLFGGSGSTLIACEQLNRKCRTMELDEHYCDVIRKRWAEYVHGEGCDWVSLTPKEN
jgi:site-specific DNA-methyltransferase (adenine-specific)